MFDDLKDTLGSVLSDIGVKDANDFTLLVSSKEIPVLNGRLVRSIDTCVDGCTATIALNDDVRDIIKPFGFEPVEVFLGGELALTGVIYGLDPKINAKEKSAVLHIFSEACDVVDSTTYPPYEFNFVTLADLAEELIGNLGFNVEFEDDTGSYFFDRVTIDPQQTIFDFLSDLARQHGVLLSSNEFGRVLFRQADISSKPVETIEQATELAGSFNGRSLFGVYRMTMMSPETQKVTEKLKTKTRNTTKTVQTTKYAETYDALVPASRQTTINADNVLVDDLPQAVEWERSKRWAKALEIQIPRIGWRPKGSDTLYRENTKVTLKTADLWLANGFDFLIKSVEYSLDSNGAIALLTLIPPQAYTGDPVPDIFGGSAALSDMLNSLGLPSL